MPNKPKKKEANRLPAIPQIPILLKKSRMQNKRVPVRKISDFTCGFIGSLTTGSFTCLFAAFAPVEAFALEDVDLLPADLEDVDLLPEDLADVDLLPADLEPVDLDDPVFPLDLRFAVVADAAGFFVVFGLLFCVGFLEAFLTEEDVPLCAITNLSLSDHHHSRYINTEIKPMTML